MSERLFSWEDCRDSQVSFYGLVFVGRVRPEAEFQLHPQGTGGAEEIPVVEVVLQPDLRELARQEGDFRREPRALTAVWIARVEDTRVAAHVIGAQAHVPSRLEAVDHLGIEAVIAQGFRGQAGHEIGASAEPAIERLRLP